jgi:hypothetical protein
MPVSLRIRLKWLLLAVALSLASQAMAGVGVRRDPAGTDRPGGDVLRTLLPSPDPDICVRQCLADGRCVSYTYVRPGLQDPLAVCYLKSTRRPVVRNKCCESGVKIGVPNPRPPGPPTQTYPPHSPNQDFCSKPGLVCGGDRRGQWNSDTNSCDCPPP